MASGEQIEPTKLVDIVYHFTEISVMTDFGHIHAQRPDKEATRTEIDTAVVHPSAILVGVCDCCGEERQVLKCMGCKNAQYCDKDCQAAHWETHQDVCEGA